jgi:TRAP-type uncharacterized transport system substrate-binding protein
MPELPFSQTRPTPPIIRSRLALEVASEIVGYRGAAAQARITLLQQGSEKADLCLFGSNAPSVIPEVARGEVQLAIVNPSTILALAYRGKGPFSEPLPVRTITVLPSPDQFVFALAEHTGCTSLADVRDRKYPLKVTVRAQADHGGHVVINEVLGQYGFSTEDIKAWGGEIQRHGNIPVDKPKAVARGEIDAIFDEGVSNWIPEAAQLGMHIVNIEEPVLQKLEEMGFRRARVSQAEHPEIPSTVNIMTIDFSGWAVFTHADTSDELVQMICNALEARRDRIPWEDPGELPLERMCIDAPEAPLPAPLHRAAESFWRGRGYL